MDSDDQETRAGDAFAAEWQDDGSAFQPDNIPLKRVARAWERRPHSPYAQRPGVRKIWRRVRMPVFTAQASQVLEPSRSINLLAPEQHVSIYSPKKAVKKLCLKTPFGQDWRTTEWEARGTHTRKKAIRAPIILRSGAVIDPNVEAEQGDEGLVDSRHPDSMSRDLDEVSAQHSEEGSQSQESEWEDVESDPESAGDTEAEEDHEAGEDLLDEEEEDSMTWNEGPPKSPLGEIEDQDIEVLPVSEPKDQDEAIPEAVNPTKNSRPASDDVRDEEMTQETHSNDETDDQQDVPDIEPNSGPHEQSTSDNSQESAPAEFKHRPRMSADDTAFLTAFLSRQAANKKPSLAKRESLTNRRDSGMVRQALASPAKPEILAELDANSPSPHKAARPEVEKQGPASPKKGQSPTKDEEQSDERRPARRSGRSRARPELLLNQMAVEAPTKAPSKITIRGSTEQVNLKKSEVQELAAQTRTNTRKNKGGSVMPLVRLSRLNGEPNGQQSKPVESGDSQSIPNRAGKNVQWDETLVYFSKSPDEPEVVQPKALQAPDLSTNVPVEEPPLSPTKARSKRTQSSKSSPKKGKVEVQVDEPTAQEQQVPDATPKPAPSKSAPAATKRRSRIATPAKGLLSKASLLPDDIATSTQEPAKPAAAPTANAAPARSLPTPKRIGTNNLSTALKQCQTDNDSTHQQPPAAAKTHQISPRKPTSSIPSITSFAPRIGSDIPKLSFEEALSAPQMTTRRGGTRADDSGPGVPGLHSPAKKRRRAPGAGMGVTGGFKREDSAGGRREEAPVPAGLASPAKRRTRGVV